MLAGSQCFCPSRCQFPKFPPTQMGKYPLIGLPKRAKCSRLASTELAGSPMQDDSGKEARFMGLSSFLTRCRKKFFAVLRGRPSKTASPSLPSEFEDLSRFIFTRDHYSRGRAKQNAF